MNDCNLTTYLRTLFPNIDTKKEAVCLAQPHGKNGFAHYPATDRKLKQIERRPGEWYVCVSTVAPAVKDKSLRRRKSDCQYAYVIMLDDIGTKAAKPPIEPSVILETSKDNFQYVYLIDPYNVSDEEGRDHYEACLRGLAQAGYGDEGALEVNRIFRIPGSINVKPGRNKWPTRVTLREPDRVWTLDDLMGEMGVEPKPVERGVHNGFYNADIPEGFNDPVLDWLSDRGWLGEKKGAFIDIKCPWRKEHTTGDDKAGYSPLGGGEYPLTRGFNCFHEHCVERTAHNFVQWLAEQDDPLHVSVSGVKEFNEVTLKAQVAPLTTSQRYTLLVSSLPKLHRGGLPDCVYGKKDAESGTKKDAESGTKKDAKSGTKKTFPKAAQLTTRENIQYIADAIGAKYRMNMLMRDVDAGMADVNMQALVSGAKTVTRAITDIAQRIGVGKLEEVRAILGEIAEDEKFHPFEDYLNGLTWDGVSRLDALAASVHVKDHYKTIWPVYLRRWLVQCVQAAMGWRNPKMMRNVLVLQGAGNIGKTTWLSNLIPAKYFKEGVQLALHGNQAKDSVMTATRYTIVELGELDSTFSKSESGALKAYISNVHDSYRSPYGRGVDEWPRCTSYCASVNRLDFLIDDTGNSRYWPVEVKSIDWGYVVDHDQLWAELVVLWRSGMDWNLNAEERDFQTNSEGSFRVVDEAEELLCAHLDRHTDEKGNWEAMTASRIAEHIGVVRSRSNLSIIRRVCEERVGPRRARIGDTKRAWKIPMKPKNAAEKVQSIEGSEEKTKSDFFRA